MDDGRPAPPPPEISYGMLILKVLSLHRIFSYIISTEIEIKCKQLSSITCKSTE